jgi:hypothetical protein
MKRGMLTAAMSPVKAGSTAKVTLTGSWSLRPTMARVGRSPSSLRFSHSFSFHLVESRKLSAGGFQNRHAPNTSSMLDETDVPIKVKDFYAHRVVVLAADDGSSRPLSVLITVLTLVQLSFALCRRVSESSRAEHKLNAR